MNKIQVIGLGSGDIDQLPLGIYKKLINEQNYIYLRTSDHPVVTSLAEEGVNFTSFDFLYEESDQFEAVYEQIVKRLKVEAKKGSIVYAVPGHPMLAEQTVQLLLSQNDVDIEILGGQSYLDDLFTSLKIDPIKGFQFVDATSFDKDQLNYEQHLIFCQVYDRFVASNVKLNLLEDLSPEHLVTIVEAAGSVRERLITLPLKELDHHLEISNLTTVYIPPVEREMLPHTFNRLQEVIATLRGPGGCEWDKAQTHESLRPYAIEEVYELIDAIDAEDDDGIIEELGDVLLQVMLHSQIGEDNGYFSVADVIRSITNKMIHRHPHVFKENGNEENKTWDELKREEKGDSDETKSILSDIPTHLPSLMKAEKIQKRAAKVGFDWDDVNDVWNKLKEELGELKEAIELNDNEGIESEFGDVFFVLVNLARFYKINPDISLNRTNNKFISRFTYIEDKLEEKGKELNETSLKEMDYYWDQAKGEE